MPRVTWLLPVCVTYLSAACGPGADVPRDAASTGGGEDLILTELDWQKPLIEPETLIETEHTDLTEIQRSAVAVVEEHLDRLLSEGWEIKTEHRSRSGGEFTLVRGVADVLKVNISAEVRGSATGRKGFVVIRSELSNRLPTRDAVGFEPPDIPRYPGSTRLRWMNILGEWSGKYLAVDDIEAVRQFYVDSLPKLGWIYKGLQAGKLHFEKGGIAAPGGITQDDVDVSDPLGNVSRMIPSAVNIILSDEGGIANIGFGRSAGAGDATEVSLHSEPASFRVEHRVDPAKVVARVDPETRLPWYPGFVDRRVETEWFSLKGPEVHVYTFNVPRERVQSERLDLGTFYRSEMPAKGWTLVHEDRWGDGTQLDFRRGGVTTKVSVRNTGERFIDNPNVSPSAMAMLPVVVELRFPVPERNIAGEDVPDVPRFPDSMRYYYLDVAMDHVVKFKTAGTADQVYEFFLETLPQHGWMLSGADQESLMFTPQGSPGSGTQALGSGQLVPTILTIRARDEGFGIVDYGMDLSKGDV